MLAYTEFDRETTKGIFSKLCHHFLSKYDKTIKSEIEGIIEATIDIYD